MSLTAPPSHVLLPRSSAGASRDSRPISALNVLGCLGLIGLCVWFYTRNNDFPIEFHTDEAGKVEQILSPTGQRNFRHPQLLLESTQLATAWLGTRRQPDDVVLVGRWVSAAFATGAVVALAMAGYRIADGWGFILVGLSVALCPSLVYYSHVMKEDTALTLGLCVTLAAIRWLLDAQRPASRLAAVAGVGAACALAASGKYHGLIALALALPLVLAVRPLRWWSPFVRLAVLLTAFALVWAAINYRALADWTAFRSGFDFERNHSASSHNGLVLQRPAAFFTVELLRMTLPHVLALAGVFVVLSLLRWRRGGLWEIAAIGMPLIYVASLATTVLFFHRYLLPAVVLLHFLAALALLAGARALAARWRRGWLAAPILAAAVLALQLPACLVAVGQFREDGRYKLRQWIAANVRPGTLIAADDYAGLRTSPQQVSMPRRDRTAAAVQSRRFAPDVGDLPSLRRMGYQYAVVCELTYSRYFDPRIAPIPRFAGTYQRHRDWYAALEAECELVWQSVPRRPTFSTTDPAIKVYRLSPAPEIPAAQPSTVEESSVTGSASRGAAAPTRASRPQRR